MHENNYSDYELVSLSLKRNLINELFTEMLSDCTQKTIIIQDVNNINLNEIMHNLSIRDVLITNQDYRTDMKDFMVMNSSGDVLLDISPGGNKINGIPCERYLEDELPMHKLVELYKQLQETGVVYTLVTAEN